MKIKLTKKQIDLIIYCLFEYSEICLDQGTEGVDDEGNDLAYIDKNATSHRLAKDMEKVLDCIHRQIERQK